MIEVELFKGHKFNEGAPDNITSAKLNRMMDQGRGEVSNLPISVADGGTGAEGADVIFNAQKNLQVMGIVQGWIEFSDTDIIIGQLPTAPAFVFEVRIGVEVLFNDSGTDLIRVGSFTGNDGYSLDQDVSALGLKTPTMGSSAGYVDLGGGTDNVHVGYTGQNANATTGKALIVLTYALTDIIP